MIIASLRKIIHWYFFASFSQNKELTDKQISVPTFANDLSVIPANRTIKTQLVCTFRCMKKDIAQMRALGVFVALLLHSACGVWSSVGEADCSNGC